MKPSVRLHLVRGVWAGSSYGNSHQWLIEGYSQSVNSLTLGTCSAYEGKRICTNGNKLLRQKFPGAIVWHQPEDTDLVGASHMGKGSQPTSAGVCGRWWMSLAQWAARFVHTVSTAPGSQQTSFICPSVCHLSCVPAQLLSRVRPFVTPWTVARQAPLPMGFFRQEYWSGLPFLTPGDLPDPGVELASRASPALAGRFFTTSAYRFLRRQVRWSGIPTSLRIFHSLLWSTRSKALA